MSGAASRLRFVLWNPLATSGERLADICTYFKRHDVIVLPGTNVSHLYVCSAERSE